MSLRPVSAHLAPHDGGYVVAVELQRRPRRDGVAAEAHRRVEHPAHVYRPDAPGVSPRERPNVPRDEPHPLGAVAPGTVLLPDDWDAKATEHLRQTTPLQRTGSPDDVSRTVLFILDSDYLTGETIVVDGGRNVRR